VLDTVDTNFTHQWLDNLQKEVGEREINYLIINHMEPDHSANIYNFMKTYPHVKIVSTKKSFSMMKQFFGDDFLDNQIVVSEGDTLSLGKHTLTFYMAPMVHWPEVMVTYDLFDKILFTVK
jgi:flavorubredoxin